ncbi:Sec-independent protein translocase family protein [Luteipulveratus halotolerans]|uniref:Preprotein translocase subunit TatA n=1 Tax=Luteipulveratus halotolerans TaxID=1631356 RepID=A0A0L6CFC5_9MICO|nr:preprotein translocase subunit TatA [Luteipulveratus halotolerans]KNX36516.1 preprotein translocase subunit TatA [Luteipulveratus halotolerans]
MLGINTWEFFGLLVLAMLVVGPDRLPEYVAKLRGWIRQARDMAEGAQSQLKDQMGPEFQDVDWKQYDPRQYDPRKIVRQALLDEPADPAPDAVDADAGPEATSEPAPTYAPPFGQTYDPDRMTPWDLEAT